MAAAAAAAAFRTVRGGEKELREKLGRNDLCPCGSGRKFQEVLPEVGPFRRREPKLLPTINKEGTPSGALFCLAEFLSLLSLRLLHPDALKSARSPSQTAQKRRSLGALVLGTPGLRQRGVGLIFRLP